ncbi:MAG: hypothetical protein U0L85_04575 [Bacilli bacterium]|nr:hypothetical protein [Bacilli bacterium]
MKLGFSSQDIFKEEYVKELNDLYASIEVDACISFVVNDNFVIICENIGKIQNKTIKDTMNLLELIHYMMQWVYLQIVKKLIYIKSSIYFLRKRIHPLLLYHI